MDRPMEGGSRGAPIRGPRRRDLDTDLGQDVGQVGLSGLQVITPDNPSFLAITRNRN